MNELQIQTKGFKWGFFDEKLYLWVECPSSMKKTLQEFILSLTDKLYAVTVKEYKPKRSLNANNYSWALSDQLADALRISKEECHFLMLKRYGQKTVISVQEEGCELLEKAAEYIEQFGSSEINGKTFYHYKIWKGSHNFDSREMAIFIDGIVSECKEQGIPTETPEEIAKLKSMWGKESK